MSDLQGFVAEAVSRGVRIDNGILPQNIHGRGVGVLATRDIENGEILLSIPTSALRTEFTVSQKIRDAVQGISIQGLLALDLMLDTSDFGRSWMSLMPGWDDMRTAMPFWWPASLQILLPESVTRLVNVQRKKLDSDWSIVCNAFPSLKLDDYEYHWFLVGTRTFYYTPPEAAGKEHTLDPYECLAMIPVADFFNHSDYGCEVIYTAECYSFRSDSSIRKGDEVYISYGSHSNDFLLAEYGFCLESNDADMVSLDEVLDGLFSDEQREQLQSANFWGKFVLQHASVCYRTEAALRVLCMPEKLWQLGLDEGFDDDDVYATAVNGILVKALESYTSDITKKIQQIGLLDSGLNSQKEALRHRWEQILQQLSTAIAQYKDLRKTDA